ncbi:MAG: hypothetical protein ABH846_01595, partial [Patescibacteria group bacterium]
SVTNNSVEILANETCLISPIVTLSLKASQADQYQISNYNTFEDASWRAFVSNVNNNEEVRGDDLRVIDEFRTQWTLGGGIGNRTVYVRYKSVSGNISSIVADTIRVDEISHCQPNEIIDEAPDTQEMGPSPVTGEMQTISQVVEGDYIKAPSFPFIYYITDFFSRRPIINLFSYFTYQPSLSLVKIVTDATLPTLPVDSPVFPKEGTVLLKFESAPAVYMVFENKNNPKQPILRAFTNEDAAASVVGETWPDYVYTINSGFFNYFLIINPILAGETIDVGQLMTIDEIAAIMDASEWLK